MLYREIDGILLFRNLGILTILKDTGKEEKLFRPMFSFSIFGLIIGCMKYKELFSIIKMEVYIIDKYLCFLSKS